MRSSTCPWNRNKTARRSFAAVQLRRARRQVEQVLCRAALPEEATILSPWHGQNIQRYANNLIVFRDRNEHGIASFLDASGSVRSSSLAAEETSRKRGCKCQHPRPIHLVNTISPPRPTTRPPLIIIGQRRISTVTGVTISPKSIQPPLTTIARWPTSIPAKRTSSRKNSCGLHYWIRRRFARRGVWLRQIEQQNLGLGFGLDDERGLVLGGCAVTLPHLGAVEGDDTACRLQP
jgi:hypothetical protein